ncbi:MAG: Flp family type IVb pilin [Vicinamibacterales bacterium]
MQRLGAIVRTLAGRSEGQDLLEYSMLAALIAVIAVSAVTRLGNVIDQAFWQLIANSI